MMTKIPIIFLCLYPIFGMDYQIEELTENPGLYFEKIADIHYTRNNWKILTFVDIQSIYFNKTELFNYLEELRDSNSFHDYRGNLLITRMHYYKKRINHINSLHIELLNTLQELKNQPANKILRRGAAFGIIGIISKSLFGTLSEKDGEYYNHQINNLKYDYNRLASLTNDNLHVVEKQFLEAEKEKNFLRTNLTDTINMVKNYKPW